MTELVILISIFGGLQVVILIVLGHALHRIEDKLDGLPLRSMLETLERKGNLVSWVVEDEYGGKSWTHYKIVKNVATPIR